MGIKFKELSYVYNNQYALEKISTTILPNKITCLIGKSGSGKTTFLELINGLLLPNEGEVKVDGIVLKSGAKIKNIDSLRSKIGLVFQFPEEQFFKHTVYDEVGVAIDRLNYKKDQKEKRIIEALKMVGLNEAYLTRNPFSLSNGEKRKIAIASVLVYNPQVILLDEPTVGLDQESIKSFVKLLSTLKNKYNKTIVVASHDIEFVHLIADHIIVLNNKIVTEGDKYTIFKDEKKLNSLGIRVPKIMEFINKVYLKKKIRLRNRDKINDLIKDIYSNVD